MSVAEREVKGKARQTDLGFSIGHFEPEKVEKFRRT